ncbi:SH3 domain-containing protein [Paeniglutamicibacter psychrophenolicus]|uniref:SH3 domain-containing protein n=1 Tax=Paeniglutamicibacter psychrophenolicus TaxID=257454 RepID=UPI00278BABB9|nr:SH3 domain-containing protein [Paeniglutamicibacter psychrophenolicus]MDQ0095981.1 uncharacterized protein YgiM (DUF1202 family) [Paeniglutamicibacter psychrophenolicus]
MQRKHLGVALALAVALVGGPTSIATAQPLAPIASVGINTAKAKPVKLTTANLNLRKTTNVKSASLLVIPKNTRLTILKTSGIWNQVTYKSKTGWVSGNFLKPVAAATAKVYNYTKAFTTVKAKSAANSANVVSVHRQTKMEVIGKTGSWSKVVVSGKTGFVPSSALSASNPAAIYRWVNGKQPVFQGTKTTSKKLGTLSNNTRIQWLRTSGSWQQVRTSAGIGWMQSSKLSNAAIKPPAKPKVYNYTKAFTTVKAKAAASSSSVLSIHRQTKVEVLGKSGSWTKVVVSGKTGFVPASALSKTNPAAVYRWVNGQQPVFQTTKTTSKKLGALSNNTKIQWLRTSGSWQQVRTSVGIGWMQSSKLSTKAIKAPAKPKAYNYTKAFTTVKAKSAANSANVVSVHRQTKMEVIGKTGSWIKVVVSGKTGFVPSSALSASNPAAIYRWVKGNQPVFQSTNTSSRKLATLSNNTKIQWLRNYGSWQQVRTSAGIGWMQSSKLSNAAIKPPAKPKVYNYTNAYTTVKSAASASSANLVTIHRQTKVEVLGKTGSWSKIVSSGKTGFVPSSTLSKTSPAVIYRWVNGSQRAYAGTSTTSKAIIAMPMNTKVQWLRTSGSWQQVRTSAGIGWMDSKGLSTKVNQVLPSKPPVTFNVPRWATANVNLRSGSGTNHSIMDVVSKGDRVMLGTSSGGWANIEVDGRTGWVSAAYLATSAPQPPAPKPDEITFTSPRWTTANLNLRSGAGTNHDSIGVVPVGERVLLGRFSGGWANVKTSKGTGWVSALYLATSAPPPKPVTQHRWATGTVNVRLGSSTVYPVIGQIVPGEKVTYLESRDKWARVISRHGTGWISEAYLTKTPLAQLQPETVGIMNAVESRFGDYVSSYGGVRPGSVGHSQGLATDIMIKNYKTAQGVRNGDEIADFLIANRESLRVRYLIWQDKIWLGPAKGWEEYSKSGKYGQQFTNNWNDTTKHLDHIHAETYDK